MEFARSAEEMIDFIPNSILRNYSSREHQDPYIWSCNHATNYENALSSVIYQSDNIWSTDFDQLKVVGSQIVNNSMISHLDTQFHDPNLEKIRRSIQQSWVHFSSNNNKNKAVQDVPQIAENGLRSRTHHLLCSCGQMEMIECTFPWDELDFLRGVSEDIEEILCKAKTVFQAAKEIIQSNKIPRNKKRCSKFRPKTLICPPKLSVTRLKSRKNRKNPKIRIPRSKIKRVTKILYEAGDNKQQSSCLESTLRSPINYNSQQSMKVNTSYPSSNEMQTSTTPNNQQLRTSYPLDMRTSTPLTVETPPPSPTRPTIQNTVTNTTPTSTRTIINPKSLFQSTITPPTIKSDQISAPENLSSSLIPTPQVQQQVTPPPLTRQRSPITQLKLVPSNPWFKGPPQQMPFPPPKNPWFKDKISSTPPVHNSNPRNAWGPPDAMPNPWFKDPVPSSNYSMQLPPEPSFPPSQSQCQSNYYVKESTASTSLGTKLPKSSSMTKLAAQMPQSRWLQGPANKVLSFNNEKAPQLKKSQTNLQVQPNNSSSVPPEPIRSPSQMTLAPKSPWFKEFTPFEFDEALPTDLPSTPPPSAPSNNELQRIPSLMDLEIPTPPALKHKSKTFSTKPCAIPLKNSSSELVVVQEQPDVNTFKATENKQKFPEEEAIVMDDFFPEEEEDNGLPFIPIPMSQARAAVSLKISTEHDLEEKSKKSSEKKDILSVFLNVPPKVVITQPESEIPVSTYVNKCSARDKLIFLKDNIIKLRALGDSTFASNDTNADLNSINSGSEEEEEEL